MHSFFGIKDRFSTGANFNNNFTRRNVTIGATKTKMQLVTQTKDV